MTNIYNLFKFIESKRPEYRTPLKFKLIHAPETITPEELHVDGDLNLADSKITSLPAGLQVGGYLNLHGTKIESLPTGLHVVGSLDLRRTPIASLPAGLHVGGFLNLKDTKIAEKYSAEEIRKMIEDTGGSVKGAIYT